MRARFHPVLVALAGLVATVAVGAAGCRKAAEKPVQAAATKPPVEARSSVDRAVATTGDLITYRVTVEHDPGYEIDLPEPGADIAGFRIVDLGRDKPKTVGGRVVEERWYQLRADLVGSYVLPPVTVRYRRAGGAVAAGDAAGKPAAGGPGAAPAGAKAADGSAAAAGGNSSKSAAGGYPDSVETSEIFVEVESVLPADGTAKDIRDIKPLVRIAERPPWLVPAAAALAIALLAAAGWWWWRRRRLAPAAPPRPAHEIAFAALDALRRTDFADLAEVRRYYFAVSEVLRAYVEARFGLNATDLTREEIHAALPGVAGLDRAEADRLDRFLGATDGVKFAAQVPSEEEIRATYEDALSFVEATRTRPEPPAAETASAEPPAGGPPAGEPLAAAVGGAG